MSEDILTEYGKEHWPEVQKKIDCFDDMIKALQDVETTLSVTSEALPPESPLQGGLKEAHQIAIKALMQADRFIKKDQDEWALPHEEEK